MGFPMRYPRFFIVLFVALGLAALPAVDARATDADPLSDAPRQVRATPDIAEHASAGADIAPRGGIVDLLVRRTDLDNGEAGRFLDAVTGLVRAVTGAGERAGMITSPEIDALLAVVLGIAAAVDPQPGRALVRADVVTEQAVVVTEILTEAERAAMEELLSIETVPVADPIEQWRPLVEQYFAAELVEEALSIIDCESNGDPNARNPRTSASGLFQFLDRTWSHSSEQAGFRGASPLSPEANVAAAAWLVEYSLDAGDSAWAHWTCRP